MKPQLDMIGIVAEDLAASLAFYRLPGLDIPAAADVEPHVEVTLASGLRLAWDPVSTIKSLAPDWEAPTGSNRVALAFLCDSPEAVDSAHARLTAAGHASGAAPWNAV